MNSLPMGTPSFSLSYGGRTRRWRAWMELFLSCSVRPQDWPGNKRVLQSAMMIEGGRAPMSTSGIVGEEIGRQAALASVALQDISGASANADYLLPRGVLAMLGPYSAAKFFAERVLESGAFNVELVQALYSKLLPLERMVDDVLAAARQRGRFDDPDAAEPLRWLETCNEQVKDCMVE